MYLDKIIKRETISLIVIVCVVLVFSFTMLYISFFSIKESNSKENDLVIKYCDDIKCSKQYSNYNNVLGAMVVNDITTPQKIKNYKDEKDIKKDNPYIFNIKNNSDIDKNISLKLKENLEYSNNDYLKYLDYLKVSISECDLTDDIETYFFKDLDSNVLKNNIILRKDSDKTYCVWFWLNSNINTLDKDIYFTTKLLVE